MKQLLKNPFFYLSVVFYLASAVVIGYMFSCCLDDAMWGDEGFSLGLIEFDLGWIAYRTLYDVHPPLYYVILKMLTAFGADKIIMGKIVSVLPFVAVFVYGLTFLRKDFGPFTAAFITFALCTAPQFFRYSSEIRMYSWAIGFVGATLVHAYEVIDKPKQILSWIFLSFHTVCAAYTNYFAAIAVFFVWIGLLVIFVTRNKKQFLRFCITGVVSILLYLPWAILYIKASYGQYGSIGGDVLFEKWRFFYAFAFGYAIPWYYFQFLLGALFTVVFVLSLVRFKLDSLNLMSVIAYGSYLCFFLLILISPKVTSHPIEYHYLLPASGLPFLTAAAQTGRLIGSFRIEDIKTPALSAVWNGVSKLLLPVSLLCCITVGGISTTVFQVERQRAEAESFAVYREAVLDRVNEGDVVVSRSLAFTYPVLYCQLPHAQRALWQRVEEPLQKDCIKVWSVDPLIEALAEGKQVFFYDDGTMGEAVKLLKQHCDEQGIPHTDLGTWTQVDTVNCATSTIYLFGS
ncbi:MAG: hypothetical protein J5993_04840 [Clostridia bacterium]|nr:hypothetical protein [Clostridia bacterium]